VRARRGRQPGHRGSGGDAPLDGGGDRRGPRPPRRVLAAGRLAGRPRAAVEVPQGPPGQAGAPAPPEGAGGRARGGMNAMSDAGGRSGIRVERGEAGAVWVTLDRPEAKNALSRAVNLELARVAAELGRDDSRSEEHTSELQSR